MNLTVKYKIILLTFVQFRFNVQPHTTVRRYVFRSHVIEGEPIAINRAQLLTPSCYWEFHRETE